MFRRITVDLGDMALALILWLCSLPLVAILVVPFWGVQAAAVIAVGLFFLTMAICWGTCSWKIIRRLPWKPAGRR